MENKQVMCDKCGVTVSSPDEFKKHLQGKKHKKNDRKQECGIFITNIATTVKKQDIYDYFSKFGPISSIKLGKNSSYVLLDFAEASAVKEVLKHKHQLHNRTLFVRISRATQNNTDNKQDPLEDTTKITNALKDISDLNDQIRTLMLHVQPAPPDAIPKYRHLCSDLEHALRNLYPECRVHPFGSTMTGLCFKTSDVDVYVELQPGREPPFTETPKLVNNTKRFLMRCKLFKNVVGIPHARTPIVKCVHVPTGIRCDFNFKNGLGVCNTFLIRNYLFLDEKVKSVLVVLKYWGKVVGVCGGNSGFSNYSVIMLALFYMQENFGLPAVEDFLKKRNDNGWSTDFDYSKSFDLEQFKSATVYEVIYGFFEYYSKFDYSLNVVCPLLGKRVLKLDFLTPESLPSIYSYYKNQDTKLKVSKPICVQDPIELSHNITTRISETQLEHFIESCKKATEIFITSKFDHTNLLSKLFTNPTSNNNKRNNIKENTAQIRLPMTNIIYYLKSTATTNTEESMRKIWYDLVNQFLVTLLIAVLKMEVTISKPPASDNSDSVIQDVIVFNCKAKYNLWECRKSVARDVNLNIPSGSTVLEREIAITGYIRDVLGKGIEMHDTIMEVNLVYNARVEPTAAELVLEKVSANKGCFKTFSVFFVSSVPSWLNGYMKELEAKCQVAEEGDG